MRSDRKVTIKLKAMTSDKTKVSDLIENWTKIDPNRMVGESELLELASVNSLLLVGFVLIEIQLKRFNLEIDFNGEEWSLFVSRHPASEVGYRTGGIDPTGDLNVFVEGLIETFLEALKDSIKLTKEN